MVLLWSLDASVIGARVRMQSGRRLFPLPASGERVRVRGRSEELNFAVILLSP
jgi:hypothetical protein